MAAPGYGKGCTDRAKVGSVIKIKNQKKVFHCPYPTPQTMKNGFISSTTKTYHPSTQVLGWQDSEDYWYNSESGAKLYKQLVGTEINPTGDDL